MFYHIKNAIPLAKRIWEFSANWLHGFDEVFAEDMALRDQLVQRLQSGQIEWSTVITQSPGGEITVIPPQAR